MSIYSRYFEKIDHKAEFKAAQEELDKEKDLLTLKDDEQ